MKVSLADRLGNVKKVRIGFSFFHFFTGPLYALLHLKIFTFIFEALYMFYLLPIPGMEYIVKFIKSFEFIPDQVMHYIEKVLMIFRMNQGNYYFVFGILVFLFLHTLLSLRIRNTSCRRYMKKKQLLPLDELDARKLIKCGACKTDVSLAESFDIRQSNTYKSAEENWYENNQTRIQKNPMRPTRSTLSLTKEDRYRTRIEQVENSYKLGLISKNEHDRKIKNIKENK